MTAQMLYEKVKLDALYFLATGGGVTFGGGEPLLYPGFLQEFRKICGPQWHLCAETSLSVPWENVQMAAECIDVFYVDCKDTNVDIYRRYTGKENSIMLENLGKLVKLVGSERIVVRLPLIPEYNTEEDRRASQALLTNMGLTHFDLFTYRTEHKKDKTL
jgi:pyruvate formate lyase activating enzyme